MTSTGVAEKVRTDGPAPGSGAVRQPRGMLVEVSQHRRHWWFKAPPEASKEDPLHESYWSNVNKGVVRHDLITLLAFDESWEAEFTVERPTPGGLKVKLRKVFGREPLDLAGTPIGENHRTEYRANGQWCVARISDGVAEVSGCSMEAAAIAEFYRRQPKSMG